MPKTFLEESIIGEVTCGEYGRGILQKRINLPRGKKFTLETIEIFDDNGSVGVLDAAPPQNGAIAYFVSPYPILLTKMPWGNQGPGVLQVPDQGPPAANPNILFKKIGIKESMDSGVAPVWKWSQYPSNQIAAEAGRSWYTPHLYITAVRWGIADQTHQFNFSVGIQLSVYKSSRLMAAKHHYQEFIEAQTKLRTDLIPNIPYGDWIGQTFPAWTYGGVRPENVMSSSDILTYYSDSELLNPETARTRAEYEAQFLNSQDMVNYDEAFGDVLLELPEWLNLTATGVTTGPIRQQWPPNKYADNGNTLTL
jgi:hypothetical protein